MQHAGYYTIKLNTHFQIRNSMLFYQENSLSGNFFNNQNYQRSARHSKSLTHKNQVALEQTLI